MKITPKLAVLWIVKKLAKITIRYRSTEKLGKGKANGTYLRQVLINVFWTHASEWQGSEESVEQRDQGAQVAGSLKCQHRLGVKQGIWQACLHRLGIKHKSWDSMI